MDDIQALLSAIDLAMGAERKAKEFYADAAEKAINPRGKDLLRQLAESSDYQVGSLRFEVV